MKKVAVWCALFVLIFAPAALACGNHAYVARDEVIRWINNTFGPGHVGGGPNQINVSADQIKNGVHEYHGGYADAYILSISLPPQPGGPSYTFSTPFIGGAEIESYLQNTGINQINQWFQGYQPASGEEHGGGFTG